MYRPNYQSNLSVLKFEPLFIVAKKNQVFKKNCKLSDTINESKVSGLIITLYLFNIHVIFSIYQIACTLLSIFCTLLEEYSLLSMFLLRKRYLYNHKWHIVKSYNKINQRFLFRTPPVSMPWLSGKTDHNWRIKQTFMWIALIMGKYKYPNPSIQTTQDW